MKRVFITTILLSLSASFFCQTTALQLHQFFISAGSGTDINLNAYRIPTDNNGLTFNPVNPHYHLDFNMSYLVLSRLRPRLELSYVRNSYDMDWGDFNSTFSTSRTYLNNIDINLFADYLLVNQPRFQNFLYAGLKNEFVLSDRNVRTDKDGDTEEASYNFIGKEYPTAISGAAFGSIFRFQVNDRIGIFLKPEYTLFFRNFVRANQADYQRLGITAGIEFGF